MNTDQDPGTLRIGTRRSALAKAQTNWVIEKLTKFHPQLKIEITEIVTTGDKILNSALSQMPGKGVFVKEIEEKLSAGEIDLAVHSMKDLPTEFPEGLKVGAVTERVDPRDVFISRLGRNLEDMPEGAKIGTSSLRRKAQLLKFRSDFELLDIRGNIDTRLKKSETREYDGIILAAAGLIRMGWQDRIQQYLSCGMMIPAVGQGALGIEIRRQDEKTEELIAPLNNSVTEIAVNAERTFLEEMGGGCQTPMGAFCRERDGAVTFQAFYSGEDGSHFQKEQAEGNLQEAMHLAEIVARRLKENGRRESAS